MKIQKENDLIDFMESQHHTCIHFCEPLLNRILSFNLTDTSFAQSLNSNKLKYILLRVLDVASFK